MIIYDALKEDHQKVLALIDQLIASEKAGPETWGRLVQQIRDELVPHSRAEEAILYNSMRDIDQAKDVVAHSYGEHMQAETLLRGLQVSDAMNLAWVGAAKKLRSAILHHVADEEGKVFPAAQRVFSSEEARAMGDAFTQMKAKVRDQSFVGNTIEMIANMLPTRLRESVRKFKWEPGHGHPKTA